MHFLANFVASYFLFKLIQILSLLLLLNTENVVLDDTDFWIFTAIHFTLDISLILISRKIILYENFYFINVLLHQKKRKQLIYAIIFYVIKTLLIALSYIVIIQELPI